MLFQELTLTAPDKLNAGLFDRFMALYGTDRIRQSHHFGGRFENSYIDAADIPDIATLLKVVKRQAGELLDVPADTLKVGFWFNAMEAGHRTAPHHHDENDELLSAVYYVRVPENSGDLVLHDAGRKVSIRPHEGQLVMFSPTLLHEVTANLGSELRLSVAMNIGPADP